MKDIYNKTTGLVKQITMYESDKQPRYKKDIYSPANDPKDIIDFCLNCTKYKCNGYCEEYKKFAQQVKGIKNVR